MVTQIRLSVCELVTEDDEQIVLTIAAQVAAAIERSRLQVNVDHDLQSRMEEQQALDRVRIELNETLLLDRILDVIRGEALRTTSAEDVSVVLFYPRNEWSSPDAPRVEIRLGAKSIYPDVKESTSKKDNRLTEAELKAFSTGAPVFIEDFFGSDLKPLPVEARSAIVQPILFGE